MTPALGVIVKIIDSKYEAPLNDAITFASNSIMIILAKRAGELGIDLEKVAANEGIKIILTIQPPETEEHHCENCGKCKGGTKMDLYLACPECGVVFQLVHDRVDRSARAPEQLICPVCGGVMT